MPTQYTTLNKIKSHDPCTSGWTKLLIGLGKTRSDDEPLPFTRILEINGIADAIWALRTCDDRNAVLTYAADCAEHVVHIYEAQYPDDPRPRNAISTLRRYIAGEATEVELRAAARAAACAAADAADRAAIAAYAAVCAADAAAYSAADAAARAAADAAEREWQTARYRKLFGGAA